jgi:Protein of unknown function (DUF3054)
MNDDTMSNRSGSDSRINALVAVQSLLLLLLLETGALAFVPSPSGRAVAASMSMASAPPLVPYSFASRWVAMAASPLPTDQQQPEATSLITATSTTATTNDKEPAAAMSSIGTTFILGVVDLVMLLVFAATGRASHVDGASLDIVATLYTAAPFVTAWFLAAPWTGVYQENPHKQLDATASYPDVAMAATTQTLRGWVVAMPLGCVIRGVVKGYVPPLPFVVVTLVATFVLLSAGRVVYAVTARYLEQSSTVSSSSSSIRQPRD